MASGVGIGSKAAMCRLLMGCWLLWVMIKIPGVRYLAYWVYLLLLLALASAAGGFSKVLQSSRKA